MKKKHYLKPTIQVFTMNVNNSLLAGSYTETPGSASGMSSGSFGARSYDYDDEY